MEWRGTLIFVEVKTRLDLDSFGDPEEAITFGKRQHLIKCALSYLQKAGREDSPIQFDVVSISPNGIRHFPDAIDDCREFYF